MVNPWNRDCHAAKHGANNRSIVAPPQASKHLCIRIPETGKGERHRSTDHKLVVILFYLHQGVRDTILERNWLLACLGSLPTWQSKRMQLKTSWTNSTNSTTKRLPMIQMPISKSCLSVCHRRVEIIAQVSNFNHYTQCLGSDWPFMTLYRFPGRTPCSWGHIPYSTGR